MKLIFCDKNKKLVKKVSKLFKENKNNKANFELIISEFDDVFQEQEKSKALICTASNPKFAMNGGLDKQLKEKFNLDEGNLREFVASDKIFPLITVDYAYLSNKYIIRHALAGVFSYRFRYDFILTGIGTAIGGLDEDVFLQELKRILDADLSDTNLSYVNLRNANLSCANLRNTNLSYANLSCADLRNADLSSADLSYADLSYANLSCANLSYADLSYANLSCANLRNTNLSSANLSYADLSCVDLSLSKGLITMADWFDKNFKHNTKGYIVYKAIGNTSYSIKDDWEIKEGKYLTENVNRNHYDLCGCGVNFGTLDFINKNYKDAESVWECLIEYKDLVDTIVPINSDGKARTSRLKLIKKIK